MGHENKNKNLGCVFTSEHLTATDVLAARNIIICIQIGLMCIACNSDSDGSHREPNLWNAKERVRERVRVCVQVGLQAR